MKITNRSRGPRTIEVRDGKATRTEVIPPGGTLENVEVANPDDPVFRGMCEGGDLVTDDLKGAHRELDKIGEEEAGLQKKLHELNLKRQSIQGEIDQGKFSSDPKFREERSLAMAAGNTPGYADPLPPGTVDQAHVEDQRKGGPDRHAGTSSRTKRSSGTWSSWPTSRAISKNV